MFFFIKRLFYKKEEKILLSSLNKLLCFCPRNLTLYKVAFQYKSSNGEIYSNERLEFLGDAALSAIIGHYLFQKYPNKDEGFLTEVRSRLVNRENMGILAKKMGIDSLLQADRLNSFSYGNALEALIGAIYLDVGYDKCYKTVLNIFSNYSDFEYVINTEKNFKSLAFEWANKFHKEIEIKIIDKFESNDQSFFRAQVSIDSASICLGEGKTKKQAEQNAARKFCELIKNEDNYIAKLISNPITVNQIEDSEKNPNESEN